MSGANVDKHNNTSEKPPKTELELRLDLNDEFEAHVANFRFAEIHEMFKLNLGFEPIDFWLLIAKSIEESITPVQKITIINIYRDILSRDWFKKYLMAKEYDALDFFKSILRSGDLDFLKIVLQIDAIIRLCSTHNYPDILDFMLVNSLSEQLITVVAVVKQQSFITEIDYVYETVICKCINNLDAERLKALLNAGASCNVERHVVSIVSDLHTMWEKNKDVAQRDKLYAILDGLAKQQWFVDQILKNIFCFEHVLIISLDLDLHDPSRLLLDHLTDFSRAKIYSSFSFRYNFLIEKLYQLERLEVLNPIFMADINGLTQSLILAINQMPPHFLEIIFPKLLSLDSVRNELSNPLKFSDFALTLLKDNKLILFKLLEDAAILDVQPLAVTHKKYTIICQAVKSYNFQEFQKLFQSGFTCPADQVGNLMILMRVECFESQEQSKQLKTDKLQELLKYEWFVTSIKSEFSSFLNTLFCATELGLTQQVNDLLRQRALILESDSVLLPGSMIMIMGHKHKSFVKMLCQLNDLQSISAFFRKLPIIYDGNRMFKENLLLDMLELASPQQVFKLLEVDHEFIELALQWQQDGEETEFVTSYIRQYIGNVASNGLELTDDESKMRLLTILHHLPELSLYALYQNSLEITYALLISKLIRTTNCEEQLIQIQDASLQGQLKPAAVLQEVVRIIHSSTSFEGLTILLKYYAKILNVDYYRSTLNMLMDYSNNSGYFDKKIVGFLLVLAAAHVDQGTKETAKQIYNIASKAPYNNSYAKYSLGLLYEESNTKHDIFTAKKLYIQAALEDCTPALDKIDEIIQQRLGDDYENIRQIIMCPITAGFMLAPVTSQQGRSFENKKLHSWFARSKNFKDPETIDDIDVAKLIPNKFLHAFVSYVIFAQGEILSFPGLYVGNNLNNAIRSKVALNDSGNIVDITAAENIDDPELGLRVDIKSNALLEFLRAKLAAKAEVSTDSKNKLKLR